MPLVVVTSNGKSHIGKLAKATLPLVKKEDPHIRFSTFSSQFAIEYVLDVLYSCLFVANFEHNSRLRTITEQSFKVDRFESE